MRHSSGVVNGTDEFHNVPLWGVLVAVATPVPLTIGLGIGYGLLSGTQAGDLGPLVNNLAYGAASLAVLLGLHTALSSSQRATVFRFTRPGRTELLWTGIFFVVGIIVFPVATILAELAGAPTLGGFNYTLGDTPAVLAVFFGGVLVAPLAEEVLFRGLLLGRLLEGGRSPLLAGGATIIFFSVIHFPLWGPAGVVGIAVWSVLPTVLRLRFNNLTGAWLLHLLNNIWSNLIIVGLGFV